tara:strand:+ start:5902 stop:6081 length:180 start_codon:yes stop_codon:yes gene_type:complete
MVSPALASDRIIERLSITGFLIPLKALAQLSILVVAVDSVSTNSVALRVENANTMVAGL